MLKILQRRKSNNAAPEEVLLDVRISDAKALIWKGQARSISTKNLEGPLDVLPMHANFITLLKNAPIHIQTKDGAVKRFTFPLAVMSVRDNIAHIYTEIISK